MWPFNKKPKSKSTVNDNTEIPIDCIFNSIIADLSNFNDWEFTFGRRGWEYYKNLKKGYKIICYTGDNTGTVAEVDSHCFTDSQQRILYEKCQIIYKWVCKKKDDVRRIEDKKFLKSIFLQCFR